MPAIRPCTIPMAILIGIAASIAVSGGVKAQEAMPSIADLSWIAGSWSANSGSQTIEEHWTPAASNALLGMGRTIVDGRMTAFEYLRIVELDAGVFYIAQPNGRPPTSFRLTQWDGEKAIFENPDHDFPKRIVYTRHDANAVTVNVDAGDGTDGLTFTFSRIER
jgi:hypothetical protein